jgi:hypothetical protein
MLQKGTGAVSRYKLSRSQKTVTVQDYNCGQMRVSGCKNHYKSVWGAGVKAKSVTSLLTLPSVLALVFYFDQGVENVFGLYWQVKSPML